MTSPWIEHVAAFRKAHPGMDNKLIFAAAKKTYKGRKQSPKKIGGGALGALSPAPVSGMSNSGTDLDTQVATQRGGAWNALSPAPVSGMSNSGTDLDTQVATQHGGNKRSANKRSANKRSANKRSANKRSANKRSAKKRSAKKRSAK